MALAMEVGWRASGVGNAAIDKKRSWGEDQQKLFDLMIGTSERDNTRRTLDLFGSSPSNSGKPEFVELDPEIPLPNGWEKRLDLKSGTVYFVNWNTGTSTREDPRKASQSVDLAVSHEFLTSRHSEMLLDKKHLVSRLDQENPQPSELRKVSRQRGDLEEESLELNLNLAISYQHGSSVCTMEKVQQALARAAKLRASKSSAFHTTAAASELSDWILPCSASPATSTSSSSSSSALAAPKLKVPEAKKRKLSDMDIRRKHEGSYVRLTGCKQCLMYVMLSASDLKCPRCGSAVVLDFPSSLPKSSNVELNL